MGSEYVDSRMIFDTTSAWTIVNTADVDTDLPSSFVLQESKTALGEYRDVQKT